MNNNENVKPLNTLQQGSSDWLETRRKFKITASEAADALGVGPNSRKWLWRIKKNLTTNKTNDWAEKAMRHGTDHEELARQRFMTIKDKPQFKKCGMYVYNDDIAASPDGVDDLDQPTEILEIKCPYSSLPGAPKIWHLVQIQVQLQATKAQRCHFWCYKPPGHMDMQDERYFHAVIERDDVLWNEIILPGLNDFISLLDTNTVPLPMKSKAKKVIILKLIEKIKTDDPFQFCKYISVDSNGYNNDQKDQ
jgi:putative phage-type endonuclease